MSCHSLIDDVRRSARQDVGQELFGLKNDRVLGANLSGHVRPKTGCMIPDVGGVLFSMRVDGSSVAVVQPKNESYLEDSSSAGGSRAPCTHRPLLAL